MDKFNNCCQFDMFISPIITQTGTEKQQHRAETFSTTRKDIITNLADQLHIRSQVLLELVFNRQHLIFQQCNNCIHNLNISLKVAANNFSTQIIDR